MFSRFRPRSHGPGSRNSDASMGRNDTRVRSTRSRAEDGLHSHTIKKGKDDGFPTLTAKGGMSLGLRTTEWLKDAHLYTASDNKMSPGLAIVFASTPPAITLPPEDPPIPEGAGGQGVVAKVILASHLEKLKRLETLREKFNLDKQALFYKCRYAIDDYLWAKLEEGFAEYPEMMEAHDLAMLVSRIYVALVNIRSGNPEKDKYNLAKKFFELKMHHNESIVDFKKRIEDYENERVAYELPLLSEGEMVTAILEKVEPQLRLEQYYGSNSANTRLLPSLVRTPLLVRCALRLWWIIPTLIQEKEEVVDSLEEEAVVEGAVEVVGIKEVEAVEEVKVNLVLYLLDMFVTIATVQATAATTAHAPVLVSQYLLLKLLLPLFMRRNPGPKQFT